MKWYEGDEQYDNYHINKKCIAEYGLLLVTYLQRSLIVPSFKLFLPAQSHFFNHML